MLPDVIIRADATPRMGTGHVMRCLALALAAREAGLDARMACRVHVPWVRERLAQEAVPCALLDGAPPAAEDPRDLLRQLRAAGLPAPDAQGCWVVTDGYHFTEACQHAVRQAGYRLLVIDDYAHLPEYDCDILLNQNIGAERLAYGGTVGRKLLGPGYALLRPEFRRSRGTESAAAAQGLRVLLTLGGGDFSPRLRELAPALRGPEAAQTTLRVLSGAMREADIREALAGTPAAVRVLPRVDDMAALLRDTDLCVTAGGSTCWELACMGVPFLTVQLAENQRLICQWLEENDYAPRFSAAAFTELLQDDGCRRRLSARLRVLVDGQGACRVVDAMRAVQAA